ncbi:hypothetical protein BJF78_24795 [Pseudonocardia sp. CNS-139]|nr:hypothetical protein BJF78_24795 [Pseudonocardia sp. CNS-139]
MAGLVPVIAAGAPITARTADGAIASVPPAALIGAVCEICTGAVVMARWWRRARESVPPNDPALNDQPSPSEENRMTAPPELDRDDPVLADLRAQIAALDAEAAGDPAALAADLDAWAGRDERRRDRRLQLERQARERAEYGELLDDPHLAAVVRQYVAAVAEPKVALQYVADHGTFPTNTTAGSGRPNDLRKWWTAIGALARELPEDIPDASRYVRAEIRRWYRARDGYLSAFADRAGVTVPRPELDGPLPHGLGHGLHYSEEAA